MVDLAFPMGDLVMLMLLIAGMAPNHFHPNLSSVLLIIGVSWLIVGDMVYVSELASNSSTVSLNDLTFVIGLWLMGLAASTQDRRRWTERNLRATTAPSVIAVPVISGVLAIGIVAACLVWTRPPEVGGLALGALTLVMARMWLVLRQEQRRVLASTLDARIDSLTGLPNRRFLFERVDESLRSNGREQMGVIMIDLDRFKGVNDSLGHGAGDELLSIIAHRFASCLGRRGSLARLGGDEFVVVVIGSERELLEIAGELHATTTNQYTLGGSLVNVGASLGVAMADRDTDDAYQLLHRADKAMYEAKHHQSGVAVYRAAETPEVQETVGSSIDRLRSTEVARDQRHGPKGSTSGSASGVGGQSSMSVDT